MGSVGEKTRTATLYIPNHTKLYLLDVEHKLLSPATYVITVPLITIMLQWSRNRWGRGHWSPNVHRGGPWPPANPEGYNIIIMPLSTKAVIQVHKERLHEHHL